MYRSLNHIYAQVIDDQTGQTLVSASTIKMKTGGNVAAAKEIGKAVAEKAVEKGIKNLTCISNNAGVDGFAVGNPGRILAAGQIFSEMHPALAADLFEAMELAERIGLSPLPVIDAPEGEEPPAQAPGE